MIDLPTMEEPVRLILGDALQVLPTLPDGCVDAVVTDPPYPEIDRDYGRMSEAEWMAMMDVVVSECRRVLKPRGSAVFILQANSERVGKTRPWLWDFLAKWSRAWGQVQDLYWWNPAAPPTVHTHRDKGLTRPSVKPCVWLGPEDCWRDQDAVLWLESDATAADKRVNRFDLSRQPSGFTTRHGRALAAFRDRGGVTPFNLLPITNTDSADSAGSNGHGAGTPLALMRWWTRYICPKGGVVLDPFIGSGTAALACLHEHRLCIGIERDAGYYATAQRRLAKPLDAGPLFAPTETQSTLFDA